MRPVARLRDPHRAVSENKAKTIPAHLLPAPRNLPRCALSARDTARHGVGCHYGLACLLPRFAHGANVLDLDANDASGWIEELTAQVGQTLGGRA
jgi:hypothetical protein